MARLTWVTGSLISAIGIGYWTMFSSYSQWLGPFPFRGAVDGDRVIALTFDDGPNEPYTGQIAQLLTERSIRATFFQVGVCVDRHPGTTRRLADAGHVIGNHSYSHRMSWCVGSRRQSRETARTQMLLTSALGQVPALYRPPWLLRTPTLARVLRRHGLRPVSGEFGHAFEVLQPSPQRIARRALAKARPGAILIFHDGFDGRGGYRGSTVEAVRLVADELISRGFRFVTIDELLDTPAYRTVPSAGWSP